MNPLEKLLTVSSYKEAKKYTLEIAEGENSIPLLIQYISAPQTENWENDDIKAGVAEALGQIGGIVAIPHLIGLYQQAKDNLSAKFYAAYALADYSLSQSGQISDEIRHILLDALSYNHTEIRTIVSSIGCIPHHIENIRPWIKHLYLEQQEGCELDKLMEDARRYFKEITVEEIKKLEELLLNATEEEMIGISIAVVVIPDKNMSYLIRPLLLKVKDKKIQELLLHSSCTEENWESANTTFLENWRAGCSK